MRHVACLVVLVVAAACSLPALPPLVDARLDPCRNVVSTVKMVDGAYCGSSDQNGFIPQADSPDKLFTCVQGRTADSRQCGTRCVISQSAMVPDGCLPDPCAQTAGGVFCGSSHQLGFDPTQASPSILYTCRADGTTMMSRYCMYGCMLAGSGSEDSCN